MSGLPSGPLASRLISQRVAAPWITLAPLGSTYHRRFLVQLNGAGSTII